MDPWTPPAASLVCKFATLALTNTRISLRCRPLLVRTRFSLPDFSLPTTESVSYYNLNALPSVRPDLDR